MKKLFVTVVALLLGAMGLAAQEAQATQEPTEVPHLTGKAFAEITSKSGAATDDVYVMLVGFKGCIACKYAEKLVLLPLLKRFVQDARVKIVKVDIEEDKQVSETQKQIKELFQVQNFPTLLVVYRQGAMWRQIGFAASQKQSTLDAIVDAISQLK